MERKSLPDLLSSLTSGRLRFAQQHVRPALVADGLAELQVRYPTVPLVFCETRPLAEECTYRYLAQALSWLGDETAATVRVEAADVIVEVVLEQEEQPSVAAAEISTGAIRLRAREQGLPVADRGRLRPEWSTPGGSLRTTSLAEPIGALVATPQPARP